MLLDLPFFIFFLLIPFLFSPSIENRSSWFNWCIGLDTKKRCIKKAVQIQCLIQENSRLSITLLAEGMKNLFTLYESYQRQQLLICAFVD
jgi:hypothetical protein